jgi:hypothetical protein
MAPTLFISCNALPPEGDAFFLGAAQQKNMSLLLMSGI